MSKTSKLLDRIVKLCIYGVVVLTPIFFLPFTYEFLEFNKQYLLGALVLIGVLSWMGKAIVEKEIHFYRTPLDIPLAIFWFITCVSGILSSDRGLSFVGNLDNLTIGVMPITFYVLFYFLVTNTLKIEDLKKVVIMVLSSGIAAAAFFMLKSAGVIAKLGLDWQFGNTVANLNTPFGIFAVVCLVLSLNALFIRKRHIKDDIFWLICFGIFLITLVLFGFKLVWICAAAALFLLLVLGMSHLEEIRTSWITVSFSILVIALIFILLGVPQFLTVQLPLEVSLSQGVSWKIATETLGSTLKQFIIGSGPATFVYDFAQFRPESLNLTFAWNVRFMSPASTFIDMLTTLGFLGTVSYVLVLLLSLGTVVFVSMRKAFKKDGVMAHAIKHVSGGEGSVFAASPLFFGVTVAWLALLAASFFLVFSTALWVLFFLFMASIMIVSRTLLKVHEKPIEISLKTSPQYSLASSFVFILVFSGVIVLGVYLGRFYIANVYYANSIIAANAGNIGLMEERAAKATQYHDSWSPYHLNLARAYLLDAGIETRKASPDATKVSSLVASAVNQAKYATDLAPKNVVSWETLTTMYENARAIAPAANDWGIAALDQAVALESSNPVHFLRRGNLKFSMENYDDAKKDYEEAVRLKANYVDAFVRLSATEEARKDLNTAILRMSDAFRFAPNNPEVLFHLGRLLYNRANGNDLDLAEQAFRGAVELNPNYSNALYSLGILLERRGKTSEALEYYNKVLRLNPDNADIRTKINALTGQ
jgi:tetratricopeptide (TPR) repeat protein